MNLLPPDAACTRLVELLNAERVGSGLAPLSPHPALSLAAQGYAEVLAGSGCFGSACGPTPPLRRTGRGGRISLLDGPHRGPGRGAGDP